MFVACAIKQVVAEQNIS